MKSIDSFLKFLLFRVVGSWDWVSCNPDCLQTCCESDTRLEFWTHDLYYIFKGLSFHMSGKQYLYSVIIILAHIHQENYHVKWLEKPTYTKQAF